MEANQARVGTVVRVRDEGSTSNFAGMRGVIDKSFGSPKYPALDVRLERGGMQLFWFHELDEAERQ